MFLCVPGFPRGGGRGQNLCVMFAASPMVGKEDKCVSCDQEKGRLCECVSIRGFSRVLFVYIRGFPP